jgi:hypothetical protein
VQLVDSRADGALRWLPGPAVAARVPEAPGKQVEPIAGEEDAASTHGNGALEGKTTGEVRGQVGREGLRAHAGPVCTGRATRETEHG